jgi:hypothetical protein
MGEQRKVYKVLVGKRPLGRPRRRWEDEMRMDLRKTGLGDGVDSVGSEQGQMAGSCEHCEELSRSVSMHLVSAACLVYLILFDVAYVTILALSFKE